MLAPTGTRMLAHIGKGSGVLKASTLDAPQAKKEHPAAKKLSAAAQLTGCWAEPKLTPPAASAGCLSTPVHEARHVVSCCRQR